MPTMTVIRVKYFGKKPEVDAEPGGESLENAEGPQEVLVNIDCPIGLIMDYIRKTGSLDGTGEIDLCDESDNEMKKVSSFPCWERGTDVLESGAVYFIVKIDRHTDGKISRILPILPAPESGRIASEMMLRLQGPLIKNRSTSATRKKSQDKIGRRTSHEKRNKIGKPASRAT